MKKLHCMTLLAMSAFIAANGYAQPDAAFPVKPIRIIVPSAPGSGPDIMARAIGQKLTEYLGQPIVIDDKSGAGGIIGAETAAKSAPDGYTLIMANAGSHAVNASLYAKLPYDPVRDFAPITLVAMAPNILIVHPALPANSVRDLIALAKSRPGELTFGSGGNGSTAHLSGEMFRTMAGINIVHIPFKGSPAAVVGVIAGQIAMAFPNIPPALPHVRSGKLRVLGITSSKRSPAANDIPTVAETVPGYEYVTWYSIFAPAKTPRTIVMKLNARLTAVLALPDIAQRLSLQGAEPKASTPEDLARFMQEDTARLGNIIRTAGIKTE